MACTGLGAGEALARTPVRTFVLTETQEIVGGQGASASVRTRIALPRRWAVVRRTAARLTLRERRGPECQYTIRVRSRVVAADASDATEHVERSLPAAKQYVLGRQARGVAAWRAVRLPGDQFAPRIRAMRAAPLDASDPARGLWVQTRISADAGRRDECHLGTYRGVVVPLLMRALAGTRADAEVR